METLAALAGYVRRGPTSHIMAACVIFAAAPFYRSEHLWSGLSVMLLCSAYLLVDASAGAALSDAAALFGSDNFSYFCRWLGFLAGMGLVPLFDPVFTKVCVANAPFLL